MQAKQPLLENFFQTKQIAQGLLMLTLLQRGSSPFDPAIAAFKAGRLMVQEIATLVRRRESFAFETTLSGLRYARLIPQWRKK